MSAAARHELLDHLVGRPCPAMTQPNGKRTRSTCTLNSSRTNVICYLFRKLGSWTFLTTTSATMLSLTKSDNSQFPPLDRRKSIRHGEMHAMHPSRTSYLCSTPQEPGPRASLATLLFLVYQYPCRKSLGYHGQCESSPARAAGWESSFYYTSSTTIRS